jgi:hypothetical protein
VRLGASIIIRFSALFCVAGDFDVSARMPRDAILPIYRDLLGSLPNESGRIQQKIDPRREWSGAEGIHGGKPACPKAVSPVLHLGKVAAFATRLVMIHVRHRPGLASWCSSLIIMLLPDLAAVG